MSVNVTPKRVRTIAEELRDELTEQRSPLIYPMAMDVIATTPMLCRLLAERLTENVG